MESEVVGWVIDMQPPSLTWCIVMGVGLWLGSLFMYPPLMDWTMDHYPTSPSVLPSSSTLELVADFVDWYCIIWTLRLWRLDSDGYHCSSHSLWWSGLWITITPTWSHCTTTCSSKMQHASQFTMYTKTCEHCKTSILAWCLPVCVTTCTHIYIYICIARVSRATR